MKVAFLSISKIPVLPFIGSITAGFPSPADDHLDNSIDLNLEIIKDRDATFFGRVEGDSMTGAGIEHGDLLVINKGLEPRMVKLRLLH